MERVFRSFKTEWMPKYGYDTYEHAQTDVHCFIKYYNYSRGHSYNKYLAPAEAERRASIF